MKFLSAVRYVFFSLILLLSFTVITPSVQAQIGSEINGPVLVDSLRIDGQWYQVFETEDHDAPLSRYLQTKQGRVWLFDDPVGGMRVDGSPVWKDELGNLFYLTHAGGMQAWREQKLVRQVLIRNYAYPVTKNK